MLLQEELFKHQISDNLYPFPTVSLNTYTYNTTIWITALKILTAW